jgi:hypothetical protein
MAVPPVATGLAVRHAGSARTLAAALSMSAFNVGIALGSWGGGRALDSSLGAAGPALIGAVGAALGLVPLLALARAVKRAAVTEHAAVAQPRDATELAPASLRPGPDWSIQPAQSTSSSLRTICAPIDAASAAVPIKGAAGDPAHLERQTGL